LGPSERAVDVTVDTAAMMVVAIVGGISGAILRLVRKRALAYFFAAVFISAAALSLWNYYALYLRDGNLAVTLFGWGFSARPLFYMLLVLPVAALVLVWLRRLARRRWQQRA
jgi:hypothetical protein